LIKASKRTILILFTCICFYANRLFAAPVSEIQEVRLAKIELALLDGDFQEAIQMLNKNLSSKNFHLPSFLFLGRYHYQKKDYSKAFRVFYFIIKKLHGHHGKQIITLTQADTITSDLKDLSPPTRETLKVYFEVAQLYLQLAEKKDFSDELNQQFLNLSAKYYQLCAYYRYSLPQTNYFLALVQGKRKKTQKAIDHYVEAKELFEKEKVSSNKEQIENIEFLLGDSLIKEGYIDAGTLFLKSLYLSPDANSSLKEYANAYLNALSADFLSFSVSYNFNYNNNINSLNSEGLESFDPDIQFSKDAVLQEKSFNAFYISSKFKRNWNYLLFLSVAEEATNNEDLATNDSRSASLGMELKYDNLIKSVAKLTYNYSYSWFKSNSIDVFGKLSDAHTITPQYIHTLKRGTLSYKLPISIFNSSLTGSGLSPGFAISYTPFWRNRWLSPTTTISYTLVDEGELIDNSTQYSLSASNHFGLSERLSIFAFASLIQNSNSDPENTFFQYSFNLSSSYQVKSVKGLSLNLSVAHTTTDEKIDGAINVFNVSTGLTYSF
jgi:hypothetical protein